MGKLKNANGIGDTKNLRCGDIMKIYIKVIKEKKADKEIIQDAKFETFGCLPPNGEVLVREGDWNKISTIHKDTKVLNSDGRSTEVLQSFKRKYVGPMLTLIPFVSPFNIGFINFLSTFLRKLFISSFSKLSLDNNHNLSNWLTKFSQSKRR